ncbi:MAG: AAA family ATPase, partial [Bdellovibrionales bacterium]|nr:AAA family ATPase [Bdellovibrionales bacterium]
MVVHRLKIRNFRNYKTLDLPFRSGVNILLGENGQGKTNLLEAIYLLCRGRSFRPGDVSTWLGESELPSSTLIATVEGNNGQTDEIKLILEGKRRQFFINDKRCT